MKVVAANINRVIIDRILRINNYKNGKKKSIAKLYKVWITWKTDEISMMLSKLLANINT